MLVPLCGIHVGQDCHRIQLHTLGKLSTPEHTDPHRPRVLMQDQHTVCLTESSNPRADVLPGGIACPESVGEVGSGWARSVAQTEGGPALTACLHSQQHPCLTPSLNHFSST